MERLTRFPAGAMPDVRAQFGRDLLDALDRLGVQPGQEFIVVPGTWAEKNGKLYKVPSSSANAVGPVGAADTSRKAALHNYPRSGTQRHRILCRVVAAGARGMTRDEITNVLGMSQSSTHPRVLELIEGEWLKETDDVRLTQTGAEAHVLVATLKGVEAVREKEALATA
jgi:hypothetical protein